jgi:hypothetical protein
MGGMIEETPTGIVETALEPIYSGRIFDPSTWLPGDHIDRTPVLSRLDTDTGIESTYPDYNAPFNRLLNMRPQSTPEEFDDFVTSQILGVNIPEETTVTPTVVPDLSAIGINPTPDYTWQEILGVQPDLGGRPAFNVDEFGNRASLARFREPEVDTDDFIRENLIEAVAPAPTVTRSQPGPGGPARDRSPEPERDRTPDPKPKPKPRKKPPRKKKKKKKKKKELVPVVSQNEIFEARHQALMDALTQGYSRAGRAVEPPSHMLYDI